MSVHNFKVLPSAISHFFLGKVYRTRCTIIQTFVPWTEIPSHTTFAAAPSEAAWISAIRKTLDTSGCICPGSLFVYHVYFVPMERRMETHQTTRSALDDGPTRGKRGVVPLQYNGNNDLCTMTGIRRVCDLFYMLATKSSNCLTSAFQPSHTAFLLALLRVHSFAWCLCSKFGCFAVYAF
jgi:hypothetical protein